jgi:hypothetical protein
MIGDIDPTLFMHHKASNQPISGVRWQQVLNEQLNLVYQVLIGVQIYQHQLHILTICGTSTASNWCPNSKRRILKKFDTSFDSEVQ